MVNQSKFLSVNFRLDMKKGDFLAKNFVIFHLETSYDSYFDVSKQINIIRSVRICLAKGTMEVLIIPIKWVKLCLCKVQTRK